MIRPLVVPNDGFQGRMVVDELSEPSQALAEEDALTGDGVQDALEATRGV